MSGGVRKGKANDARSVEGLLCRLSWPVNRGGRVARAAAIPSARSAVASVTGWASAAHGTAAGRPSRGEERSQAAKARFGHNGQIAQIARPLSVEFLVLASPLHQTDPLLP